MIAEYIEKSLGEAVGGVGGAGRTKVFAAVEDPESYRGEGEGSVGEYWRGAAEERQQCTSVLGVHSGQLEFGLE